MTDSAPKMSEREKRIAIIVTVIIVIILLLIWFRKRGRAGNKIIKGYDDANMPSLNFGDLAIRLGDLVVPDLSFYTGANSCGCGDSGPPTPTMPKVETPTNVASTYRPLQYATPKPRSRLNFVSAPPAPSRDYSHNSNFWGGGW